MPNITQAERLMYAYRASHVKRWHCQGYMIRDEDNGKHQHLVATILLICHPDPSRDLLAAALTHDAGELRSGDMSRYAKQRDPELGERLESIESEARGKYGLHYELALNSDELMWLHAADAMAAWFVIYDNIVAGNSRCGSLLTRLMDDLSQKKSRGEFPISLWQLMMEMQHFDMWNED
jgi:hypothetical protein